MSKWLTHWNSQWNPLSPRGLHLNSTKQSIPLSTTCKGFPLSPYSHSPLYALSMLTHTHNPTAMVTHRIGHDYIAGSKLRFRRKCGALVKSQRVSSYQLSYKGPAAMRPGKVWSHTVEKSQRVSSHSFLNKGPAAMWPHSSLAHKRCVWNFSWCHPTLLELKCQLIFC